LAVKIRLQRHGRKKRPFYRIVAADCRSARNGAFIERLGHYNPLTDPAEIIVHSDKTLKWLRNGAQPTDTAKNLLSKVGVWKRFHDEKLGLVSIEDPLVSVGADVAEGSVDQTDPDGDGSSADPVDIDEAIDSQGSEEE